ncbi:MAG: bifunctional tetrahydrofolate synthase/dihydrofolate synthase [Gammaproteobacteria bacterium]
MRTKATTLNLKQWTERIASISLHEVELGLERVRQVWLRLGEPLVAPRIITIAGTNGKGTCAHFLDKTMRADGRRVGLYTSPHLLRFNERIVIDGHSISDDQLCAAFEHIDQVRGKVPLTFFEFTTLAALWCFAQARLDIAVLEVGLGGRLDAVNLIDPTVAVVTRIGIDHTAFLGSTLAAIGREKAGIFRPRIPAIVAAADAPAVLADVALEQNAHLVARDEHFFCARTDAGFGWTDQNTTLSDLPLPRGAALDSLAGALAALACLGLLPAREILAGVLTRWSLAGRQQWVPGQPAFLLDVAHNPQAAAHLAQRLQREGRQVRCVVGMLADKDTNGFVTPLKNWVRHWHAVGVEGRRGLRADELATRLANAGIAPVATSASVAAALARERAAAEENELIVVCGSFHVVGPALAWLGLYSPSLST